LKRIVEFQVILSPEDRRRHYHVSKRGKVLEFVEQYETRFNEKWVAVVRYDTAHGFAHRDVLRPDGRAVKIRLAETDFNEAMTLAIQDLKANWQGYKTNFLRKARKP
jgi:hypothetical protein